MARGITSGGGRAVFVETNVADEVSIQRMVAQAVKVFGKIEILVNNAAVFVLKGIDATVAEWRQILDVNVIGAALVAKHIVPEIRKAALYEPPLPVNSSSPATRRSAMEATTRRPCHDLIRTLAVFLDATLQGKRRRSLRPSLLLRRRYTVRRTSCSFIPSFCCVRIWRTGRTVGRDHRRPHRPVP